MLKDLDFLEGAKVGGQEMPPMWLRLGMKKRAVLGQLEVDAKYLEGLTIMDFRCPTTNRQPHSPVQTVQSM